MKTIKLVNCKAQLEIATWAVDGMADIAMDEEEQKELWDIVYPDCPVKINKGDLCFNYYNDAVVLDFLYRIEEQYVAMAHDQSNEIYKKTLSSVLALANKVRAAFDMELITRDDIKFN